MKYFMDGDQMCIALDDFIDLQESPAVFVSLDGLIAKEIMVSGLFGLDKGLQDLLQSNLSAQSAKERRACTRSATHTPDPKPGVTDVYPYVLHDINDRVEMGKKRYGTLLKTQNGHSALWDLYQELIDALFYLRQELLEREGK